MADSLIFATPFPTSVVAWPKNCKKNPGVVKLSNLGLTGFPSSFRLVSTRTGEVRTFSFVRRLYDLDGEVYGEVFKDPRRLEVHVLNDYQK